MEGQIGGSQHNNVNPSLWKKTHRFSDWSRFTQLIQGKSWGLNIASLTPEFVLLSSVLCHL